MREFTGGRRIVYSTGKTLVPWGWGQKVKRAYRKWCAT